MRIATVAVGLAGAVAASLVAAPGAVAQAPGPTILRFDANDPPGRYTAALVQSDPGCTGQVFLSSTVPRSAPSFLFAPCRPTLRLAFPLPQASVQLFARALVAPAAELVATAHTLTGSEIEVAVSAPSDWRPLVLATRAGDAAIDYVDIRAAGADVGVDDLAISAVAQPDTALVAAPPARTEGSDATFRFGANRPDIVGWRCALDAAQLAPCTSPVTYTGLAAGRHTFQVAAVDSYDAVDASPADHAWTVLGPPPETRLRPSAEPVVSGDTVTLEFAPADAQAAAYECSIDGGAFAPCTSPLTLSGLAPGTHTIDVRAVDADGRADPTPERWTFDVPGVVSGVGSGVSVTDLDQDGIPDTEEVLPLGNVAPLAGVRTLASLISGRVYVKLPRSGGGLRQAAPLAGFVPLKGVASLPVGSIVDARQGTLGLQTALDGRPLADPRRRLGRARLSAAIFQIRQARRRRASARARSIATRLLLVSPPAAEFACRGGRPAKGAVRALTVDINGFFRVSGGASFAEARRAVWRTVDRCDGTVTSVRRGLVRVFDKGTRRAIIVRANRRYIARARLFQVRKGRRPTSPASRSGPGTA
jgi:hypothetical protein